MFRALISGLRALFQPGKRSGELQSELDHFLEQSVDEYRRSGMSREAAERAARIAIGSREAAKEEVRAGAWEAHVDSGLRDLRYGFRALRRNPGFALTAIATIALGIGVTTTMFSVVNAVILQPLPYRDAGRLALIWTDDTRRGLPRELTGYATVMDWRTSARSFGELGYYTIGRVAIASPEPEGDRGRSRNALVSGNLFATLGARAALGRVIAPADEAGREDVAVISDRFWRRWFGADSAVLGKSLTILDPQKGGARIYTVIGVMPAGFFFPDPMTEIWTPATTYWRFDREATERAPSWARRWVGVGRLADGASMDDARAELAGIGRRLAADHPSSDEDFPGYAANVVPVLETIAGRSLQSTLWIMLGAVTLVLLVACLNVANLLLARGASRQHEFAVRRALGGGRTRLTRQLVTESLLLALVGGGWGLVLAIWGTKALGVAATGYLPRIGEISVDRRVLLFALGTSILAGLIFGLAPALRLSGADAALTLRNQESGFRSQRFRGFLVTVECALALVLLTGAGLLLRSLDRLDGVDPGFDPAGVLSMRIEYPLEPPPTAAERAAGRDQFGPTRARLRASQMSDLLTRVRALPGVRSAGFIDDLFLAGAGNEAIVIPGRDMKEVATGELAEAFVTPGFFTTLRVPLRTGRDLTREDAERKVHALYSLTLAGTLAEKERLAVAEPVVVNQAFVRRYFPTENPVGKRFCIDPEGKTYWYEIVGVVGDMLRQGLERQAIPQWYGPYIPTSNGRADLLVRTEGDPMRLAASVQQTVRREVPGVTIVTTQTADAQLGGFSALRRLQTWLLTIFASLALALAAVGIFGLVQYAVAERTREIGVRMALGAAPGDVLRMTLFQGMRTPVLGSVVGLLASVALTRLLSSLLFEVGALDLVTFLSVAGVLWLVAGAACWLAGRRATRVDPMLALRA